MRTKTVRRDKLKRDIQKGLYVCKCNYRYTDDYRYDNATDFGASDYKEINIMDENNRKHDYDKMNLWKDDFSSQVGTAWENEDGTVTLIVHSNLSFNLKRKGA
jgi:hypothetical protein